MKIKTPKTVGTTSAAPVIAALLAGIAVGAVAYAKRKELGKVALTATEKVGDTAGKTSTKLVDLFDSAKTKLGNVVISFADGLANNRSAKVQVLRNPEMLHTQHSGESQRAA